VVVGFVFEHHQVVLVDTIDRDTDPDAAGVDFLRLVEALEASILAQLFHRQSGQIHQADRFFGDPALIKGFAPLLIIVIDSLQTLAQRLVLRDCDRSDASQEGGVTAMIRPVGIKYLELGPGRITLFLGKPAAGELEI